MWWFLSAEAQSIAGDYVQARSPGWTKYSYSSDFQLLLASRAAALASASAVEDPALKADLYGLAVRIESHLDGLLSAVVLSREDVEIKFDEMRATRSWWPDVIPAESWVRLAKTRYLGDISDVLLDGGDFWIAIELALDDEFGWQAPPNSSPP